MSTIAALRSAFQRTPETTVTELPANDAGEGRHARSQALLLELMERCLRGVRIGVEIGEGSFVVGRGDAEPLGVLRLRDASVCTQVLATGNLGLGEAYMDGAVTVVRGELHEMLTALLRCRVDQALATDPRLLARLAWVRVQTLARSKAENVQRHYDAGDDLFEAFLDPALTYSCGYMGDPEDSLEQMQINKFDRICQKLELRPGQRLLDIGCGFGGLLIHAAKHYGVHGVGITNSRRHAARGQANVAAAGLAEALQIRFDDFTRLDDRFDRVVSVGMMEHVPRREFRRYFAAIARVLAPEGRGLVHTIGAAGPKNVHDPFIQKYIFPGSSQPQLSEISRGLERERLAILDVENIVRHYGHTILRWLANFRAHREALAGRYEERFLKMFDYYFHCGIAAAFAGESAVFQVLFTPDMAGPMRLHRI